MKLLTRMIFFSLISMSLWGCYRMPTDDDYSLIPMTNNRDFTKEKAEALPGMSY